MANICSWDETNFVFVMLTPSSIMEICLWNEKISDILRAFFSMILIFIWGGQTGAGQVITVAKGEHIFNIYFYNISLYHYSLSFFSRFISGSTVNESRQLASSSSAQSCTPLHHSTSGIQSPLEGHIRWCLGHGSHLQKQSLVMTGRR